MTLTDLWRAAASTLACIALIGCTVGPNYQAPKPGIKAGWPTDEVHSSTTQPSAKSNDSIPDEWWKQFNDPQIDLLVERAFTDGYDMKIAVSRVLQSRAQNEIAGSRELPNLNADGAYDYYRRTGPLGSVRPGDYQWFLYGFDSSWELDVFGGIRRAAESASASYEASVEARRGVRITLAAEIVRNYIELRTSQRRLAIAEDNLHYQEHTLSITRQRLAAGVVTDLDVSRAAALVAATRSVIPPFRTDTKRSIRALGVLVGEDPDALARRLQASEPIPVPPKRIGVGLPADLLRRRPDLRQAERQVAAATARIGVATADLYPHLTLMGSLGVHDVRTSDLLDWSRRYAGIGPSVSWNIFDAGRTKARIDSEKAATDTAIASYQKTVLAAVAETENEMTALTNERERRKSLEESVEANKQSVATASALYLQGVTDFIAVLDAERSLATSEDALALGDQAIGEHAVSLCKALGGGWNSRQSEQPRQQN